MLGDTTSYQKRSSRGNLFLPIGTDFDKGKSLVNTWRKTQSASNQFTAWQTWEHLRVLECPNWRNLFRMPSGIAGCAWGKSAVATPASFLVWKPECTVDMHQYASQISILEHMQQMLQWIKFCYDMLNFIWQSDCTLNYCGSLNLNASNIWHLQQCESPALGSQAWSSQWNYLTMNTFQQRAVEVLDTSRRLSMAPVISCHVFPKPWILEESETQYMLRWSHNDEPFMLPRGTSLFKNLVWQITSKNRGSLPLCSEPSVQSAHHRL